MKKNNYVKAALLLFLVASLIFTMCSCGGKKEEAPAPAPVAKAAPVKEKGGAGRKVLKVLLVILIIIFVIELAGIAIKWLAPDSGAAEFIDNQLNKIIHLITGSQPDYQIPGIDYEV